MSAISDGRIGLDSGDNLDQRHDGNRVEVVSAEDTPRVLAGSRDLRDGDRRRVGRDDRLGAENLVQLRDQRDLVLQQLADRLGDELPVSEVGKVRAPADATEDDVCGLAELALLLGLGQRRGHSGLRALKGLRKGIDHDNVAPTLRADLCDSCAHDSAADDTHAIHAVISFV